MSTPIRSILRSVSKSENEPLNILTFVNYPYYDSMFCKTQHRFHAYNGNRLPSVWLPDVMPQPSNYMFSITPDIPINMSCDLILIHNKLQHYEVGRIHSAFWHLPMAMVHQLCPRDLKYHTEWSNLQKRDGHLNIFLSDKIQAEWGKPGFIIKPGVAFPAEPTIVKRKGVGHIPVPREELKFINNLLGSVSLIKNGDLSECDIVVNTTNAFYPVHILHAMANGRVVITIDMPELNDIITHEETGFIAKNITDFRMLINHLQSHPSLMAEVGQRARDHIQANFSEETFVKKMRFALQETAATTYTR